MKISVPTASTLDPSEVFVEKIKERYISPLHDYM